MLQPSAQALGENKPNTELLRKEQHVVVQCKRSATLGFVLGKQTSLSKKQFMFLADVSVSTAAVVKGAVASRIWAAQTREKIAQNAHILHINSAFLQFFLDFSLTQFRFATAPEAVRAKQFE